MHRIFTWLPGGVYVASQSAICTLRTVKELNSYESLAVDNLEKCTVANEQLSTEARFSLPLQRWLGDSLWPLMWYPDDWHTQSTCLFQAGGE